MQNNNKERKKSAYRSCDICLDDCSASGSSFNFCRLIRALSASCFNHLKFKILINNIWPVIH